MRKSRELLLSSFFFLEIAVCYTNIRELLNVKAVVLLSPDSLKISLWAEQSFQQFYQLNVKEHLEIEKLRHMENNGYTY